MKTVILAGGKGTRLSTLTKEEIPKPMVKVFGKPLLEYQINWLKKNNVREVTIMISHLGEVIKNYFGDGRKFGVTVNYFEHSLELGSAGCVKSVFSNCKEQVLVCYGDLFTNFSISDLLKEHEKNKAIATICVHDSDKIVGSIIEVNKEGRLKQFVEKPSEKFLADFCGRKLSYAGIILFESEVLSLIPEKVFFDFGKDLIPSLVKRNDIFSFYLSQDKFQEMGTIENYQKGCELIRKNVH